MKQKTKTMKRFLPFLSIAVLLAACGNNTQTSAGSSALAPASENIPAVQTDTTGLAAFQQWKMQQELAAIEESKASAVQYAAAAPVRKVKKTYQAPVKASQSVVVPEPAVSYPETVPGSEEDVAMSSESSNAAEAPAKKGWSKSAKGAVIGAATGAAAGAVINKKNRAAGAVIGGVIGAGGGYVIGRGMDKKDGRY